MALLFALAFIIAGFCFAGFIGGALAIIIVVLLCK